MKRFTISLFLAICFFSLSGCDRIYGFLHKPGGEERAILGEVVFNEYNAKVEAVQKYLRLLGYAIGRSDGKFGASTRDAVARFQADEGLEVTRFVDKATWASLQYFVASPFVKNDALNAKAIQHALVKLGYDVGRVDGQMGTQTKSAIRRFQKARGLGADGLMGLKTLRVLIRETASEAPAPVAP
ncbi:MAG: peptidoglycan-binding protein [Candidatus Omnitrophica bacterium]|nr:peptidoglycan-binding protein [Candidatus Omnitrophota bacterium]